MLVEREVKINVTTRNPRDMTDEETMRWMQDLIETLTEQKGSTVGACSLEALKSRVRREILNALAEKPLPLHVISEKVGVTGDRLAYHLNVLRASYFIQIEADIVDLTPGGVSVIRSTRRS